MQTAAVQELSTQRLAVRDRFPFWADVVVQALVPLECDTSDRQNFVGTIRYRRIGMMSVADVHATPMRVRRTRATIAQAAGDDMIVAIHVAGGCQVGQGSNGITMTNNLGAAVVTRARYQFEFSSSFHQVVLKLPCGLLRSPVNAMGGDVVRLPAGASKLVYRLALAILDEPDELSPEEQSGIEHAFADLVQPSLSSSAARAASAHGEPRLSGAIEFIRSHLSDQMLRPSSVAAHVSLSPRSLARLFAQEGTTVDRTIWHERLWAARRALSDPASQELSITEIAFGCGFNDLSHFTRSFSKAYGVAPSLYRSEQRRMWWAGRVASNA